MKYLYSVLSIVIFLSCNQPIEEKQQIPQEFRKINEETNAKIKKIQSESLLDLPKLGEGFKTLAKEVMKRLEDLDNVMKQRGLPLFGAPGVNKSLVDMYF